MGAGFLGLALVAITLAALAYTGNLPRFILRFITPTVSPASPAELEADRQRTAALLTAYGQRVQGQEPRPREVRRIHPITSFERESELGKATIHRIRLGKSSNSDEAA